MKEKREDAIQAANRCMLHILAQDNPALRNPYADHIAVGNEQKATIKDHSSDAISLS
jgi:hypothetical protein